MIPRSSFAFEKAFAFYYFHNVNVSLHFLFQMPIFSDVKSSQRFTKSHRYQEPGRYDIRIIAENLQGNTTNSHLLVAEHPVLKYWKLTSNSPQLLPGNLKNISPKSFALLVKLIDC